MDIVSLWSKSIGLCCCDFQQCMRRLKLRRKYEWIVYLLYSVCSTRRLFTRRIRTTLCTLTALMLSVCYLVPQTCVLDSVRILAFLGDSSKFHSCLAVPLIGVWCAWWAGKLSRTASYAKNCEGCYSRYIKIAIASSAHTHIQVTVICFLRLTRFAFFCLPLRGRESAFFTL